MNEEAPDIGDLLEAVYRMEHVLGMAAAYLEHPDVKAIPFAKGSEAMAKRMREEMDRASALRKRAG